MNTGNFYFLKDEYFVDFPDKYLMRNKESVNGQSHDRPCFYAFQDEMTSLYWLIPLSSNTEKYEEIHNKKLSRFGRCDTIAFSEVLGFKKAFLIQNMCPIIPKYIQNEYIDSKSKVPVKLAKNVEVELRQKANRVLALERQGRKLVFPDVLVIEKTLLEMI